MTKPTSQPAMMLSNTLRQAALRSVVPSASAAVSAGLIQDLHQQPPTSVVSLFSLAHTQQSCHTAFPSTHYRYHHHDWRQRGFAATLGQLSMEQTRNLSTNSQTTTETDYPVVRPDHIFVYNGPLAQTVTRLKKLSLFSCACAFTASPIIMYMSSASTMGAKASIAVTLCGFGAFTTGMMHWFTSPYVHNLTYNSKTGLTEVETLTLFARHQRRTFSEGEVQSPQTMKPQATFQVHGQVYYLDADNFENKELLAKLTPKEPEVAPQEQ